MKKASSIGGNDDGARDASCFCPPCNCPSFRSLLRPRGPFATQATTGNGSCHVLRVLSREESADPAPV